jgi:hypothetical protein
MDAIELLDPGYRPTAAHVVAVLVSFPGRKPR